MSYEISNKLDLNETMLYEKTLEDLQLVLLNERAFMYPENAESMTAAEKLSYRKDFVRKCAMQMFMEAVHSALETIDDCMDELISATAPRETVVDGDVKTLQGWRDSGVRNFPGYVREGDKVSYDVVEHFVNCIPPKHYESGFFQMGEPQDSAVEGNRYMTFIYLYRDENYGEVWMYKGNCLAGSCLKGTEIVKVQKGACVC